MSWSGALLGRADSVLYKSNRGAGDLRGRVSDVQAEVQGGENRERKEKWFGKKTTKFRGVYSLPHGEKIMSFHLSEVELGGMW